METRAENMTIHFEATVRKISTYTYGITIPLLLVKAENLEEGKRYTFSVRPAEVKKEEVDKNAGASMGNTEPRAESSQNGSDSDKAEDEPPFLD